MTEYDFILRLVLALVFGGVIGIERKRVGKAAGFRTQMMVCLGSALFTILSFYDAQFA
ncbi:MAG TPA: MgtC/SapB family protein, partial [Patescibacteria group bacterium]|nr:MgtC/SapB family protein [Patescibacteria group bacterium]